MKKIANTADFYVLKEIQKENDFDICFTSLLTSDYKKLFKKKEFILINDSSLPKEEYIELIKKLKPDWYVLPFYLDDRKNTVGSARTWNLVSDSKKIGIIQGVNLLELSACYRELEQFVDMVAISNDSKAFKTYYSGNYFSNSLPKKLSESLNITDGRISFLNELNKSTTIKKNKPHLLLGCNCPYEGHYYKLFDWVNYVSTNSTITGSLFNKDYGIIGTGIKEESIDLTIVKQNIEIFKKLWKE